MKFLVTGNLGFVFSHVTEYLLSQGHQVTGLDACYDGSHRELIEVFREKYKETYRQYIEDINNIDSLYLDTDFDWVIHAAAESNVDKSIEDKKSFIHSNIMGTYSVLDWCVDKKVKNVLLINTDEVYGSVLFPATENTIMRPGNPYSASKACQSSIASSYENTHGLYVKEVRMCNIIGPRQANTKLIPRVIECIKDNKEIPVYDGGTATREYMDVRDVAPLLLKVLSTGSRERIHNLTNNQTLNVLNVIDTISDVMQSTPHVSESTRKGHDHNYSIVPSIVCNDYNFINFKDSIINIISQ